METRRSFLRKGVYAAPIVVTLAVQPGFAQRPYTPGKQKGNNGVGNGLDPQPPGNPPVNDGAGTAPGDPGNRKGKGKD